jgi:hypothetical protein
MSSALRGFLERAPRERALRARAAASLNAYATFQRGALAALRRLASRDPRIASLAGALAAGSRRSLFRPRERAIMTRRRSA